MLTRQGAKRLLEAEFQRLSDIDITFADRITVAPIVYRPTELLMAEKTVATLLSKTLEQIPKYSGKPDQDADEWMKDLTATFHMADMTESQALKIISTFLDGHPKQWFIENITIFESWNVFKTQFLHIYLSPSSKQLASNRLRTRQQRYDETVIEYYTDVIKLCRLVDTNMTDASKLDHLYHGLKPSLMKDVLRGAPSTPADFLEQARREENLDRLVTTSIPQTNDNDTQAINYSNNSWYSRQHFIKPIEQWPVINQNIHKSNPSLIFINTLINGSRLRAMIDTGVTHSFITQGALSTLYNSAIPSCDRIAQLGDGQTTLKIVGEIQLVLQFDNVFTRLNVLVVKNMNTDFILGSDWCTSNTARIDYEKNQVSMRSSNGRTFIPYHKCIDSLTLDVKSINVIHIPPRESYTVQAKVELSSADTVYFSPVDVTQSDKSIVMSPSLLHIHN
ncbi:unnamed protein product, partial [Rotaria magnacalcarata]